jgi:hypothetical protein
MLVMSAAHDFVGARASEAALRTPGAPATHRLRSLTSLLGRAVALLALVIVFVAILLVRGSW